MCTILIRFSIYIGLLLISLSSFAAVDVHEFKSDLDRQRYQSFIDEMRCPKCQNQNLSGSDSPIAMDLRRELYLMIEDGKSDREIVDFMVERYGEFILYRPRLSPATLLLWGTPVFLLVFGIILLLLIVRKRRRIELEEPEGGLSVAEQGRLASLLNPSSNNSAEKNIKKSKQEKAQ